VTAKVLQWLDGHSGDQPFFLYVHTIDPHAPYEPMEPFRSHFAARVADRAIGTHDHIRAIARKELPVNDALVDDMLALYDAEVAENDHSFGVLVEELKDRGLYEDTLIIFLSDHGEEFREHGVFGHGWDLYGEVMDVPLIVKPPWSTKSARVGEVVQHVDVVPTVLAAVGREMPDWLEGVDLLGPVGPDRVAVSYMDYEGREGIAVTQSGWKMIEPLSAGFLPTLELFDRGSDPGEVEDLAAVYPVRTGLLRSVAMKRLLERVVAADSQVLSDLDDETKKALEALGYLE
jgi:arylsulfatase A-like enzyme